MVDNDYNIKLIDYGFAKNKNVYLQLSPMGTHGFMAPEVLTKNVTEPEKIDVFSAGVVLFMMVSGCKPFE